MQTPSWHFLIRREPSDFEGAIEQERQARERSEEGGTAALDYLFLVIKDEEKVYKVALGTCATSNVNSIRFRRILTVIEEL